jgi:hypothetical protein
LVERFLYTEDVGGSSPSSPTTSFEAARPIHIRDWQRNGSFVSLGRSKLADRNVTSDLILADESNADPFVVGGTLRLPAAAVEPAIQAIQKIKSDRGIAPGAKIHCRELFAGNARLKSPFKTFDVKNCQEILESCVDAANAVGARWYGTYCDASAYPSELRLIDGKTFPVQKKHVAALTVNSALMLAEGPQASNYQFAFDPDPSLVDWGWQREHRQRISVVRIPTQST